MEDKKWDEDEYVKVLFSELKSIADFMVLPENINVWTNMFDIMQFQPTLKGSPVCSALSAQIVCTPTGVLYPCYVHRNPKVKIDYSFGDVYDWIKDEKLCKVQSCTVTSTTGLEECANCSVGFGCKRCSAHFAELYGEMYKGDTSFCKAHHAKYYALQYLIKKRGELI